MLLPPYQLHIRSIDYKITTLYNHGLAPTRTGASPRLSLQSALLPSSLCIGQEKFDRHSFSFAEPAVWNFFPFLFKICLCSKLLNPATKTHLFKKFLHDEEYILNSSFIASFILLPEIL